MTSEASGQGPEDISGLLHALGAGAYTTDEQGVVTALNNRAEKLLGRAAAAVVGQDAHDLLHRSGRGERVPRTRCALRQSARARTTAQGEDEWLERGDGSLLRISWLVTPWEGGRGASALTVFHPVDPAPLRQGSTAPLSQLERLALLAETTQQLTSTLDVDETLSRLVHLVLPRLADWAVVDLITEHDEVRRAVVAHVEDGAVRVREELQGPMPPVPAESPMPLSRALRGVASSLTGPQAYQGPPDSDVAVEQRRLFDASGMHSAVIVPIHRLREAMGALTLGRSERPDPFTEDDLALLEDIARRTGLALDNARLYQRQRKVAETMQRHLLPQMPRIPGLRMTARYLPAPDASQVGGDWYDAFILSEDATAVAVGDVVGHDLEAAAGMAQMRNMLRAFAWVHPELPSRAVEWLDQACRHIVEVTMATLVLAHVRPAADGSCEVSWTNAGHPPPLLVAADGPARYLTDAHDLLLGVDDRRRRTDAAVVLPPGSTLVLYTDGLIESRGQTLDDGMETLRRHATELARRPLDMFTDQLLARSRPPHNEDDVAVLAVRVAASKN
jgi:PAS domain S-box-containing protein